MIHSHHNLKAGVSCFDCWSVSVPSKSLTEGSDEERHSFVTGDVVEVAEGDLANLKGTILSIDGNKVTIMPKHEDLKV